MSALQVSAHWEEYPVHNYGCSPHVGLRVTVKYICPYLSGHGIGFKKGDLFEFRTAVCQYEGEEFEIIISEELLEEVQG